MCCVLGGKALSNMYRHPMFNASTVSIEAVAVVKWQLVCRLGALDHQCRRYTRQLLLLAQHAQRSSGTPVRLPGNSMVAVHSASML